MLKHCCAVQLLIHDINKKIDNSLPHYSKILVLYVALHMFIHLQYQLYYDQGHGGFRVYPCNARVEVKLNPGW